MQEYSSAKYANPSSWYKEGVVAKKAMDNARKNIAAYIRAHADEIIFTSGGTEANNLAIMGVVKAFRKNRTSKSKSHPHLIVSAIEHSSIMEVAGALEKQGVEVTRIGVDNKGVVLLDEIKKAIKPNTVLVSIMMVNNEVGSVQPIREIAKIIRQARAKFGIAKTSGEKISAGVYPLFHTDAAQAVLYENLNMEQLGVDLMTLDAGKIYGPRGIGALYVRRSLNTLLQPIIFGGGQERGLRSGTENLSAIMGFAKAFEIAVAEREKESARIFQLREYFLNGLKKLIPNLVVNSGAAVSGDVTSQKHDVTTCDIEDLKVAPHILNISIPGIDNEFLLFQLDAAGIACSTKSSCLRDDNESYVLKAMGADSKTALRFSFGRWTKKADISRALRVLSNSVTISPTC